MSDNIGNTRTHTMHIMRGAAVLVKHYARHLVNKLRGSTSPRNIMRNIMRGAPVQVKYYARVFAPRISGKQMNNQRRETNEQETNEPGVYIYIYISNCLRPSRHRALNRSPRILFGYPGRFRGSLLGPPGLPLGAFWCPWAPPGLPLDPFWDQDEKRDEK